MKNSLLIIVLLSILIFGCSKTTDKLINKETIESDYKSLSEEGILTGRQDTVLNMLVTLSKGRNEYIKKNDLNEDAAKILVDEEEFSKVTGELFNELKSSEVRYGDLLSEIATLESDQKKGQRKIDSLYVLVDNRCTELQKEIDSSSQVLNKLVNFKLQNIKSGTYNYRDYVGVSILATNNSGKTVEAVSFNLKIYDKLDEVITTLICTSSQRFNNSSNLYYEYEEYDYDRRDIYKALEQTSMRRVGRTEQNIRRINLDGEILGKDQINFSYESPKSLIGFCPYINENDELMMEIEAQQTRNEQLIGNYKSLKKITEISKSLISLENIQKSLLDALRGN